MSGLESPWSMMRFSRIRTAWSVCPSDTKNSACWRMSNTSSELIDRTGSTCNDWGREISAAGSGPRRNALCAWPETMSLSKFNSLISTRLPSTSDSGSSRKLDGPERCDSDCGPDGNRAPGPDVGARPAAAKGTGAEACTKGPSGCCAGASAPACDPLHQPSGATAGASTAALALGRRQK